MTTSIVRSRSLVSRAAGRHAAEVIDDGDGSIRGHGECKVYLAAGYSGRGAGVLSIGLLVMIGKRRARFLDMKVAVTFEFLGAKRRRSMKYSPREHG